jgi:predicted nucleic acid-binding protein
VKVFLDTNVWLSATIFSGLCEDILVRCADRGWLYSSALIRSEAHEVLQRKFPEVPQASAMFDAVWLIAQKVEDVPSPANDADARFVKAAIRAEMGWFVTGDKRVLTWAAKHPDIRIVSPREAWVGLFGGE